MLGIKIFNTINGLFYALYGLFGVLNPAAVLTLFTATEYGVFGLHQISGLWGGVFALGAIMLWKGRSESARTVTLHIWLVSAGLLLGRLTGIAMHGSEGAPADMYSTLAIEGSMAIIGAFLWFRSKPSSA